MPLPDDFSPAQHLLEMLLGTHNRSVQQSFLGVPDNDLEHPLGGMKLACLLTEDDTVDMILLRLMLFWFEFKGQLPTPVYSIPVPDYQSEIKFHPQIQLLFKEDWNATLLENKFSPATAQISFRLINETSASITPSKAQSLATRVKELLGASGGFTWEKGTTKVIYRDLHRGIDFRLLAEAEAEGQRVVEKILSLAEQPFEEQNLTVSRSHRSFPTVPGQQLVYGKERRKPRERPTTRVRFYRAEMHVHGLPHPIVLLDRTGKYQGLVTP